MTLLTASGALAALTCVLVLAAWLVGRRRAAAVARALGLKPPARRPWRVAALAAAAALLGLAVAQPALTRSARPRERTGVQALFVLDISRSMAAARTATSPTRLDRAVAAATKLRAAIPDVPAGIATLTDRVLPDLLPVADAASFDAVAERSVGIEQPPPSDTGVRATTYTALDDIATGNYVAPGTARRLVVLLTDGESSPVDTADLSRSLQGYRLVAVRIWQGDEGVYGVNGTRETAYRPDPAGRVVLGEVARALGGRSFEESALSGAAGALRAAAGSGPTAPGRATTTSRTPLAPYLAGLALLLLLLAMVPFSTVRRALQSTSRGEGRSFEGAGAGRGRARSRDAARVGGGA